MDFELTPEQRQLEKEVKAYFEKNATLELHQEIDEFPEGEGPLCRQFVRQLGKDGWMGIGWPKEYGGQGRASIDQYIFFDLALGYYHIPIPMLALMTVGPTIMRVGTEEQKNRILPAILRGECVIAIAYTEPEAGTDLLSLKTTALRDGDYYVINGQKTFTSMGHSCDYFWLAVRTDPKAAKKYMGLSVFLVDAKTPGITVEPIKTMSGLLLNHEFLENVRVPKESLIGEENKGAEYLFMQLAHERVMLVPHSFSLRALRDVTRWASQTKFNGGTVLDQPWVRNRLVDMALESEVLKLLNYRVAWMLTRGELPMVESSMIKVFGSEHIRRATDVALQVMGLYGQLQTGSKWVPVRGRPEHVYRMQVLLTFGGGTNEVLRDMMAMMGLGLPRSRQ
jgi:alkylation response protein AidB-like acyl-CoA dehydrogenase